MKVPNAKDLTLDELIGQTFMIAIDTEIATVREPDIRAGRLGGAMLRWDRFTGPEARGLSAKLHEWSSHSPHEIPFWLSTDHEGGAVFTQRLYGAAPFPGNMALGATGSEKLAYEAARTTARELRAIGLQITLAPSLDVNNNPANPIIGLRSFGQDPALVSRLGRAALRGYRDGGLLAVPKHFPGHGDTSQDSHLGLPVNAKTLAQLEATELVPFRAAISDGAQAIMDAHMVFPALDTLPDQPVTLSSAAIEGFLRGRLGFRGLVFSDNLDMGAIANVYGSSEAAVLALLAGNDVLLLGKGNYPAAFEAVKQAVQSGRLPRSRLENAVDLILEAKRELGLFGPGALPPEQSPEQLSRDFALAQRVADKAVTIVHNDGLLPLTMDEHQTLSVVLFHTPRYTAEVARFAVDLARRHAKTELINLPLEPSTSTIADVLTRTRTSDIVVVGTYQFGTPVSKAQTDLVHSLIAGPSSIVAVSLMNPYDLSVSSGARAAICAYGITDSTLESVARLMFGEIKPRGHLPVSVR